MDVFIRLTVLFWIILHRLCALLKRLVSSEIEPKFVSPCDEPVLKLSAVVLAEKIRERKLFSREVIQIYIKRIKEVNPIINAVVEDRFEAALNDAKEIDRYLDENPHKIEDIKATKPFFGVPITIKEAIAVKGLSHTGCSLIRKGVKAEKDSIVVQRLKEAGLIPLLVSNTPEYSCSMETYNKLVGFTYNPYNTRYTSGGSSGGEGALIGAGASVLGIGADICGSIRIPASFCGIFGHKPSRNLVSLEGHWPMGNEQLFLDTLVIGPMTRYAEDLRPLLKIMSGPSNGMLKLDEEVDFSKIQIFYMEDCGSSFCLWDTEKEVRTAIKAAASYLSRTCHCHVSSRKFEELKETTEIGIVNMSQFKNFPSPLTDSDVKYNPYVEIVKELFGKSKITMQVLIFSLLYNNILLKLNTNHYIQKLDALKRVLVDALGDNGVLLYPCMPGSALPLGENYFSETPYCVYIPIPNLTGLPATSVPTGFDAKKLPIGIQVIAGPNNDHLTLAVAQELEKCFGGWQARP